MTAPGAPEVRAPIRDPFVFVPAALSIVCLLAVLAIVLFSGFEAPVPPSLSEQADEHLRNAGGEVVWGPERADLHGSGQDSYLFAFQPEGSGSEEIRIYDERGDDLVEAFRFGPDVDGAEFQFRALSELGGGGAKLVGGYGFQDRQSLALLPFVVRWDTDTGEYAMAGLQDEPPKLSAGVDAAPEASEYLEAYRERMTLHDRDTGRSISGHRVQDFAVVEDPDRVVSALVVDPRTASEPGLVEIRGSIMSVSGPNPTLTECRFPGDRPLRGTWSPGRLLYLEALDSWEPFIENRVCVPDR